MKTDTFFGAAMAACAALLMGLGIATSPVMAQQAKPEFRLCTGNSAQNYFKAGHIVKSKATSVDVEVIETKGSIDNLDQIVGGQCDGAFVQSDALLVYSAKNARAISSLERAGTLYQEQAHMLCNRSADVDRVVDVKSNKFTVAVGPDGSGANTTWAAFVLADRDRYSPVLTDTRAGLRALSAIADGSQVQCGLFMVALNSSFMKNDAAALGDKIVLVGTDDGDMGDAAKDSRGQPVYSYSEIPAGTYPAIQPGGTLYGTKAVKTIAVDALFVVNTDWINANERPYDAVLRAFSSAKPSIQEIVGAR